MSCFVNAIVAGMGTGTGLSPNTYMMYTPFSLPLSLMAMATKVLNDLQIFGVTFDADGVIALLGAAGVFMASVGGVALKFREFRLTQGKEMHTRFLEQEQMVHKEIDGLIVRLNNEVKSLRDEVAQLEKARNQAQDAAFQSARKADELLLRVNALETSNQELERDLNTATETLSGMAVRIKLLEDTLQTHHIPLPPIALRD